MTLKRGFVLTLTLGLLGVTAVAQDHIDIIPQTIAILSFDAVSDEVPGGQFLPYAAPVPESASSALPPDGTYSYGHESARDQDLETGWSEGASGDGVGEYLHVVLPAGDLGPYLYVFPGWGGSERTWEANNRVREALVTVFLVTSVCCDGSVQYLDTVEQYIVEFEDEFAYQGFPVGTYLEHANDRPDLTRPSGYAVKIEIVSVYPGTRWDDTVIAEVKLERRAIRPVPSGDF